MWIDKFLNLFENQDFEEALSLKGCPMPTKLFRYRPFPTNVNDSKYVVNELMHKYVYLVTAEQMDDSSDGFVKIDAYRIFEEVYGYKDLENALLDSFFRQQCDEITESRKVMAQAGVRYCSFCEGENINGDYIPANDLLWGVYANKGTGICIEYDMTKFDSNDAFQRRFMYPIIYSDSSFDATDMFISYATKNRRSVVGYDILAHMIKRKTWEKQNEWRLIYANGIIAPDKPCIPFDAISAVYIGVRTTDEVRNVILRNADSIGAPIYEMKESLDGLKRFLIG